MEITEQYKYQLLKYINEFKGNPSRIDLAKNFGVVRNLHTGCINKEWQHEVLDQIRCALELLQQDRKIDMTPPGATNTDYKDIRLTWKGQLCLLRKKFKCLIYFILFTFPVALASYASLWDIIKKYFY